MKVYFNGFWDGFFNKTDPIHIGFFLRLLGDVYSKSSESESESVSVSFNMDDAEVLVESIFTNTTYINYKPWRQSFLFTGESYYAKCMLDTLSLYTCVLGFNKTEGNFVEFPFYIVYLKSFPELSFEPTKTIPNNYTTAVISNGTLNERTSFLDKLDKRMQVMYGGTYKNNIGGKVQGHFATDSLVSFYKTGKFVITMENARTGHYITEKLINGFRAGVIPIYWGSQHIGEHFNSRRFITLEDSSSDASVNRVIDMMVNMSDEEYFKIVNEPIFNEGKTIEDIYNNALKNIRRLVSKK
jgi:hypothetical protein